MGLYIYGDGKDDYEAYVLLDKSKPGEYKFGPLEFNYEPFYIGHGKIGRRYTSSRLSHTQYYKPKTRKECRLKEISEKKEYTMCIPIGWFQTKSYAQLVEKKLMNLIPSQYLTNSLFHICDIPLIESDYEYYTKYKEIIMKV